MIVEKGLALILGAENLNHPARVPPGDSGVTIGFGYDLGQITVGVFRADWQAYLPADQIARLVTVCGYRGEKARGAAAHLADITIDEETAQTQFLEVLLPRYEAETRRAFPGSEQLPAPVFAALVSLVFNRGGKLDGPRRLEMRAIRDAVPKGDLKTIAAQLRAMKRLWEGQGMDGLLKRRDAEAQLVESCIGAAA